MPIEIKSLSGKVLKVVNAADLRSANLRSADLRSADLCGADLRSANLYGAKNIPDLTLAQTTIVPEGEIIGWKKCANGVVVKLLIPKSAKRSNATGRKCRASHVKVLALFGNNKPTVGISMHDGKTKYEVGSIVKCDHWCEDRFNECAGGIHFFLTRAEAEAY